MCTFYYIDYTTNYNLLLHHRIALNSTHTNWDISVVVLCHL